MEGHVAPDLKEVGLAGNIPSQFQGTYVCYWAFTWIDTFVTKTICSKGHVRKIT